MCITFLCFYQAKLCRALWKLGVQRNYSKAWALKFVRSPAMHKAVVIQYLKQRVVHVYRYLKPRSCRQCSVVFKGRNRLRARAIMAGFSTKERAKTCRLTERPTDTNRYSRARWTAACKEMTCWRGLSIRGEYRR